ncbi:MAG: hypothetical protein EOP04_10830 [Proteobacteria bacterium]|nr:MAG: hypothetical protein EOP04_10830 [Pseudomonadota bacterium]
MADFSVILRVRWWVSPPRMIDTFESRDVILQTIKKRFSEAGIDLPFPTQHVLLHDQTEKTDGYRDQQREGWPIVKGKKYENGNIATAIQMGLISKSE